jgi:hypothetical protein
LEASANFIFNTRCQAAYKAVMELRLNEAKAIIRQEREQNPQNGIPLLLDNYTDYFSLLASDDKREYERLKDNRSLRIDALEHDDKNSPWYRFSQAEVYLQWGMLKAQFGDFTSSALDLKKARNLLIDNNEKYPDFLPNQKGLAMIDVIFGAMPSNLKGIASFLGMKGDAQTGFAKLEKLKTQIAKSPYGYYNDELIFLLCYMDIDVLHHKDNYIKLTEYLAGMDSKSLLKVYLQGYVAAKTAHNQEAIRYLADLPKSSLFIKLPVADYLLGNAKLCRMDSDANVFLLRYIADYKGVNFIKDAYLKLAYYYLLKNDEAKYQFYLKEVRSKGYNIDEKDQRALKEANDARPDVDLLKSRLYFDGGYYEKALAQIKTKQPDNFKLLRDKIELHYRLGRIFEKMGQPVEAINSYRQAINLGRSSAYYYAANAALSIGEIYEQRKENGKATEYYRLALGMRNHEYQNSIDTQAHEGLERLKQE